MNFLNVDTANTIYKCGNALRVQRHQVYDADFRALYQAMSKFEQALGEVAGDEYWSTFLRWLKRYRFHMSAAPLPFNQQDPGLPDLKQQLVSHLARCEFLYPSFAYQARYLLTLYSQVADAARNPLLDKLVQVWLSLPEAPIAILIKEPRLIPATEAVLRLRREISARNVEVFAASQMDNAQCYQYLFVFGPARWFPKHIISAPRAKHIHTISFQWIADIWRHEPVFLGATDGNAISRNPVLREQDGSNQDPSDMYQPEDLLPTVDWKALSHRLTQRTSPFELYQEEVDARPLVLAGDLVVFVDTADNATMLAIKLDNEDDDSTDRVQRIPLSELKPGMFILLRTEGGGDYIVPVAAKIMGPKIAQEARERQERWKGLLRKAVVKNGLLETAIQLLDLGSHRANEINVRNWMSSRTIRPNDKADFLAILRLTGLAASLDEFWQYAEIIYSAHRQAGFQIRKQLLHQVLTSDLSALRKHGRIEFALPESDGGSLTAFRIEHVSLDTFQVPAFRIGELFPLEDVLWQR
jgi:hypothetical protein